MNKILTIIVPTYNMEAFLPRCLNSLIVQNKEILEKLEVLVINDGSSDSSSGIAHDYETKYKEVIRVIDKENGNYGSCVNRGLRESNGLYVRILDSDDAYDTENLKEFLTFLTVVNVDMVLSDYSIMSQTDVQKKHFSYSFPTEIVLDYDEGEGNFNQLSMHAITYKRENLIRIGYHQTEGVSYTDLEWIFIPVCTVKKFAYFSKIVYKYYLGRDGQTVDPKVYNKKVGDRIIGAKTMLENLSTLNKDTLSKYHVYLDYILWNRIKNIYFSCLVVNREDSVLVGFDNYLKTKDINLYQSFEGVKISKLINNKFIKKWRDSRKYPHRFWGILYLFWIRCKGV